MRPGRWPVRVRLAVLYAAAFLAAGVVLVAVTFWLVDRTLAHESGPARRTHPPAVDPGALEGEHQAFQDYRDEVLDNLLTWSLVALGGTLVVAVSSGWVLAGRALRPLRDITETANRVADRSLHERIVLDGPNDEVKELADTIDAMLERLDRSFDAQRRFVANASHELRTPLTVNRTLLEVALAAPEGSVDFRQLGPDLLTTNERSERLIDGLLTLARSEHAVTEDTVVDLAALVAVAVDQVQSEARQRRNTVSTDLQAAPVAGSPILLEQLVTNLVQNAVRHSPPGVDVVIRSRRNGDQSVLEVENPGPPRQQPEVDAMFEPFRRGQGRVSDDRGVGLGLSIVRSVTQAHGGQVTAHPRGGGGLVVRVDLPTPDSV